MENNTEDTRPVLGKCGYCDQDIYAEDATHYGDDIVDLCGQAMHFDCALEYVRSLKKEACLNEY